MTPHPYLWLKGFSHPATKLQLLPLLGCRLRRTCSENLPLHRERSDSSAATRHQNKQDAESHCVATSLPHARMLLTGLPGQTLSGGLRAALSAAVASSARRSAAFVMPTCKLDGRLHWKRIELA